MLAAFGLTIVVVRLSTSAEIPITSQSTADTHSALKGMFDSIVSAKAGKFLTKRFWPLSGAYAIALTTLHLTQFLCWIRIFW
jgi:hypothetical protein